MQDFFASNLKFLRESRQLSQEGMLKAVDIKRTTWNGYENDKSKPGFSDLLKIASYFNVGLSDLVERDLRKGNLIASGAEQEKGNLKGNRKGNLTHVVGESTPTYNKTFSPSIITVDNSGRENILYVPVKARLGYANGYDDPHFLGNLTSYRLPDLANGTYRMFETEGISMAPTIHPGDRVIGRYVESLSQIRENRVHVIVTRGGILVKRVLNRVSEQGKLILRSDTIAHRAEFPPIPIAAEDVLEIWYVEAGMTRYFGEPTEVFARVDNLQSDMVELRMAWDDMKAEFAEMKARLNTK